MIKTGDRVMFIFMGVLLGLAIGITTGAIMMHKAVYDSCNEINENILEQHNNGINRAKYDNTLFYSNTKKDLTN